MKNEKLIAFIESFRADISSPEIIDAIIEAYNIVHENKTLHEDADVAPPININDLLKDIPAIIDEITQKNENKMPKDTAELNEFVKKVLKEMADKEKKTEEIKPTTEETETISETPTHQEAKRKLDEKQLDKILNNMLKNIPENSKTETTVNLLKSWGKKNNLDDETIRTLAKKFDEKRNTNLTDLLIGTQQPTE